MGEYSALCCANSITFEQTINLLKHRGAAMQNSIPKGEGGMLAVLGASVENIEKILKDNKNDFFAEIANDNSNIQIVISGSIDDINKSKEIFLNNGIKKFVVLNVSAAFHSKYMIEAQKELSNEIENLNFNDNNVKIISNFDSGIYTDTYNIKKNLQNQMANKVNWTQSVRKLENNGEKEIIEIGPGKVLSGLIKRISNNFDIISINNISDI